MKTVGIAALVFSAVSCGFFLVGELERRAAHVYALCELLRRARRLVESFSMSARAILADCPRELIDACGYYGEEVPGSFLELWEYCDISDPEARRIFSEFAKGFGKGYRADQIRQCEYYMTLMSERRLQISERVGVQKKLVITLTLCVTLVIIILLI